MTDAFMLSLFLFSRRTAGIIYCFLFFLFVLNEIYIIFRTFRTRAIDSISRYYVGAIWTNDTRIVCLMNCRPILRIIC